MTIYTESIHVPCSSEQVGAFLAGVHNLPRWSEFRSVGPPVGDRHRAVTATGTTTATRIEGHGDKNRYTISSLVYGCEERAEVAVTPVGAGAHVSLTATEHHPALAGHGADAGTGSERIERQRVRMRSGLCRLRAAITDLSTVRRQGHARHAPPKSLPSGETVY